MAVITIDVIFDFVCAWCFIGKRQLEQAISLYQKTYPGGKSDAFTITWRPYYLPYNTSSVSVEKSELAESLLAHMTPLQRETAEKRVNQAGRSVGIRFKSGGKIGNTRDAHRLVYLSRSKPDEVRNALVDGLFQAYHEEARDISSKEELRKIAMASGLDETEVDDWLSSAEGADVVDGEAETNKQDEASSGVPTYIVGGSRRLQSAGDIHDFMESFIEVKQELEPRDDVDLE